MIAVFVALFFGVILTTSTLRSILARILGGRE